MSAENEFRILIEQMRAGCREAASKLFHRYGPVIVRIVRRRLNKKIRPKFDSDDFAQSVWKSFLAIPPDACSFQQPEALIAYLASMARNKVVDATRQNLMTQKHNVECEYSLDGSAAFLVKYLEDPDPRPSQLFLAEDQWQALLQEAKPNQRAILERLRQGTTHREIAAELGLDTKTVQRLVKKMCERLARQGGSDAN
jgi:RNA polymerase sigma factor (sigma-70 family)